MLFFCFYLDKLILKISLPAALLVWQVLCGQDCMRPILCLPFLIVHLPGNFAIFLPGMPATWFFLIYKEGSQ